MPTREQVRQVLADTDDYERAARRLGIHPGLAYLIATGLPADGGDTLTPEERERPGVVSDSQKFVNPPPENPTTNERVERWLDARAAADVPMTVAADARDAEPPAVDDPEEHEVTTVLGRDHNQVKELLKQLKTIPGHRKGGTAGQISRRESIVDMITVALSQHEASEQEYFWPAVRDALPDGDALAEQALQQEQEGKDTLTALGKADPDSEEFDDLVEELVHRLAKHVMFEDRVFLKLTEAMGEEQRKDLGSTIRQAEQRAPTRPHPHAPKKPAVAVKAAGAAAAAADKARDTYGQRPADRKGESQQ